MADLPALFEQEIPPGFHYRDDFITSAEELALLDGMAGIAFSEFEMRGVVARRRVAFFGQSYDRKVQGPIPQLLWPLRARLAQWAGVAPEAFAMALINEYRPGAPIGWHRDAPQYRHRRWRVAALGVPNTVPSAPIRPLDADDVPSVSDTRNHALPAIGISHDAGIAQRL